MKIIAMTLCLMITGLALAATGEVDPKECECQTCLIKNGVCIRTQPNENRNVIDKSPASLNSKKQKGKATKARGA